jgi:hypothetical protein
VLVSNVRFKILENTNASAHTLSPSHTLAHNNRISEFPGTNLPSAIFIVRLLRVFRIVRIFRGLKSLRAIVLAIGASIIPVFNACCIFVIATCIYAVIAQGLFKDKDPGIHVPNCGSCFGHTFYGSLV